MPQIYKDIEYNVERSRRRTTNVYIENDGSVWVLAPEKMTDEEIEELIETRRRWIYQHLAEWRAKHSDAVRREYVNGEEVKVLGQSYKLKLFSDLPEPVVLKDKYFCLRSSATPSSETERIFKGYFKSQGAKFIPPRVEHFQALMEVVPASVKVMELKNVWGSCMLGSNLSFHWRCMELPPPVIDYIIVHELAHMTHRDHTDAFWEAIDKVMPDYQERRDWLDEYEDGMDL